MKFIYIALLILLASCSKESEVVSDTSNTRVLYLHSLDSEDERRLVDNEFKYSRFDTLELIIDGNAFMIDTSSVEYPKYVISRIIND
jgi:hypothetical protein